MKISARRGLAASATGCALVAATVLAPSPVARAATAASAFTLTSPAFSPDQVGQRVSLDVTATTGAIDCSTITLQQFSGDAWHDVTHDYSRSGCWTGGANFVTTINQGMVDGGLRLVGRVANRDAAPLGQVTVDGQGAAQVGVALTDAADDAVPSRFGWQVGLAQVPADAVGRPVALRLTAARGAEVDCRSISLQRQDTDGDWQVVALDYQASGCWSGGVVLQATVTGKMAGHALRLVGSAQRTADGATPSLAGQSMVNGQVDVAPVTVTATLVAPTKTSVQGDPAKVDSPIVNVPAPEVPAPVPAPQAPSPVVGAAGEVGALDLPRVPWEGGAGYYGAFPDAAAGGWTDPKHFPVAVWWGGYSSDGDIQKDKALGINTYVQLNHVADYRKLTKHGMSLIGNQLDDQPRHDPGWVGDYLDDEVDGRFSASAGQALLSGLVHKLPDHSKFRYANFTGMVISWYENHPEWDDASNHYVRDFTDVLSLDSYWYSSDACDWDNPNGSGWAFPFTKQNCRTGQNYGRNVEGMRWRLAQAGSTQPVMNFIEIVEPAEKGYTTHPLTTDEVKGAAMSSIIHEARGLIWFNQAFHGRCATGNAVRSYYDPNYPCRATVAAAGEVNNLIGSLAPVLNTQSYRWSFGKDIDAMLKVHDGAAYVFAMADDSYAPGKRTFSLPKELHGRRIEVVGENRTIAPNADGTFTDTFENVNKYHVYKIA